MKKTYYLAGPSPLRELIRDFADDLECSDEYESAWDWTFVREDPAEVSPGLIGNLAAEGVVLKDLLAAATADVFIILLSPTSPSFGAAVELGTRLQAGKKAFVVTQGVEHFFFCHPLIETLPSWRALLERLDLLSCP